LEGSSRGILEALCRNFLETSDVKYKIISVRISGAPAESRNQYPQNMNPELQRFAKPVLVTQFLIYIVTYTAVAVQRLRDRQKTSPVAGAADS
jgi:hypothetical protein